jgi:hypothetical protein
MESDLQAERLIAIGQSQSSARLTTMIGSVHGQTLAPVYAGYVPHAGGAAPTRFPVPVLKLDSKNEAPYGGPGAPVPMDPVLLAATSASIGSKAVRRPRTGRSST